jgi:hypothetical protein
MIWFFNIIGQSILKQKWVNYLSKQNIENLNGDAMKKRFYIN